MSDDDMPTLPLVIEGKPPIRSAAFVLAVLSLLAGSFVAFLAWLTIPDWQAIPIGLFSLFVLTFGVWMLRAGFRPTPAANRLVIALDGLTVTHGTNTLHLAWRDILDIKHAKIALGLGGMIALYISPEIALERIRTRTGGGNPNLVYLQDLQGFRNGDLRPLGQLIDKYRQACTGLPPLYLR